MYIILFHTNIIFLLPTIVEYFFSISYEVILLTISLSIFNID